MISLNADWMERTTRRSKPKRKDLGECRSFKPIIFRPISEIKKLFINFKFFKLHYTRYFIVFPDRDSIFRSLSEFPSSTNSPNYRAIALTIWVLTNQRSEPKSYNLLFVPPSPGISPVEMGWTTNAPQFEVL